MDESADEGRMRVGSFWIEGALTLESKEEKASEFGAAGLSSA
jgi:hypothetical protein